ncbi:MAG: PAS domain S-box-containing protein [Nitrospinales bacterium]|jgi:PAS domain S-box-containing protein
MDYDLVGMKVLIIEDMPDNAELIHKILKRLGLKIDLAADGEEALEKVPVFQPDIILLDVGLPGINGLEVCQRLKQDPSNKDIPIIFLTAFSDSSDVSKGFQLGGADYITKPFRRDEVFIRITNQLRLIRDHRKVIVKDFSFKTITNQVPDLIFQLDPDRKITFANPAFATLGYAPEDLENQPVEVLVVEEDKADLISKLSGRKAESLVIHDMKIRFISQKNASNIFYSVDAFGIWDAPHDVVFESDAKNNFLGTLCIAKA